MLESVALALGNRRDVGVVGCLSPIAPENLHIIAIPAACSQQICPGNHAWVTMGPEQGRCGCDQACRASLNQPAGERSTSSRPRADTQSEHQCAPIAWRTAEGGVLDVRSR